MLFLIVVILAVVGGAFWFANQNKKKREAAAAGWNSVEGEIVSAEVRRTHDNDSDGGPSYIYEPLVAYRYTVNGEAFSGSRVNFSAARHQFPKKAEEVVARYPVGAKVAVYFDPANPRDSVLERQTSA
jgi:Protein of unknown function (DUF3592)